MQPPRVAAAVAAAVVLLAPAPQAQANPGVKVPCVMHPVDDPTRNEYPTRSGVLSGGPWNAGGPLLGVEFFCWLQGTPDPVFPNEPYWWFTPGPVGLLPPQPATVTVPDRLYVCTNVRYVAFASWSVYEHCAPVPEE